MCLDTPFAGAGVVGIAWLRIPCLGGSFLSPGLHSSRCIAQGPGSKEMARSNAEAGEYLVKGLLGQGLGNPEDIAPHPEASSIGAVPVPKPKGAEAGTDSRAQEENDTCAKRGHGEGLWLLVKDAANPPAEGQSQRDKYPDLTLLQTPFSCQRHPLVKPNWKSEARKPTDATVHA